MPRTMVAIIAGFLLWGALCVPANALVASLFPARFEPDGGTFDPAMCVLLIGLSMIYSLASGCLAAAIGKVNAHQAVWGLAIVNLCFGTFVEISYWSSLPVWYHLVFLALLIPAILYGGRLRIGQTAAREQSAVGV